MSMQNKNSCDLAQMQAYLKGEMPEDDLLDFLIHLDDCQRCRASLFLAINTTHEHYYRKSPGKRLEKEMKELSKLGRDDFASDDDELTDVA